MDVEAEASAVSEAFGGVPGVRDVDVTPHDGWCRAEIAPSDGKDLRDALVGRAGEKGWSVRDVSHRKPSLEDYYLQLFREDTDGKATQRQSA